MGYVIQMSNGALQNFINVRFDSHLIGQLIFRFLRLHIIVILYEYECLSPSENVNIFQLIGKAHFVLNDTASNLGSKSDAQHLMHMFPSGIIIQTEMCNL